MKSDMGQIDQFKFGTASRADGGLNHEEIEMEFSGPAKHAVTDFNVL
jgi:hypothetical protein